MISRLSYANEKKAEEAARRDVNQKIFYILGVVTVGLLIFALYTTREPDYLSAREFQQDIYTNSVSQGDTGRMVALEVEDNPVFGTAIKVADMVYLVGPQGSEVERDSIIEFEVLDIEVLFGSHLISYEIR